MKKIITGVTFNVAAKTITFTGFTSIDIRRIYLITNVKQGINRIIYQFNNPALAGTVSGNVLTLNATDTVFAGMSNSDELQVLYEVPDAYNSTATITRAANTTTYTANDVYGNVITLPSIAFPGQSIRIRELDIIFNITTLPSGMGRFDLYLYSATPPSAFIDNGAFSLPSGDRSTCLTPTGIFAGVSALATGGGSVICSVDYIDKDFTLNSPDLYAYLVTRSGFTPAANSETATIRVRSVLV